jgi:hypothetical protein
MVMLEVRGLASQQQRKALSPSSHKSVSAEQAAGRQRYITSSIQGAKNGKHKYLVVRFTAYYVFCSNMTWKFMGILAVVSVSC